MNLFNSEILVWQPQLIIEIFINSSDPSFWAVSRLNLTINQILKLMHKSINNQQDSIEAGSWKGGEVVG